MELLNRTIDRLDGDVIPGDVVFQLYDTYGFPADLTADVARERNLTVDMAGFDEAMAAQRERGRAAAQFSANLGQRVHTSGRVQFLGYDGCDDDAEVTGIFDADGKPLQSIEAGQRGIVVLDRTPFYAESGGQVGDTGALTADGVLFRVEDTQASGDQHLHIGVLESGGLASGQRIHAAVDAERRRRIMLNHSATHLLHAALRNVLGTHVTQKGSLVAPDRLRFDFLPHPSPSAPGQLARGSEAQVNDQVQPQRAGGRPRTWRIEIRPCRPRCHGAVRREIRRRSARAQHGR
ncbi:MAG: alanine--tRNA ligase-related protein [Gammaproteobacteria bacterium]|nr:alanine--tRNA ligase-related protein [Gammaproteobacteria bacterium]